MYNLPTVIHAVSYRRHCAVVSLQIGNWNLLAQGLLILSQQSNAVVRVNFLDDVWTLPSRFLPTTCTVVPSKVFAQNFVSWLVLRFENVTPIIIQFLSLLHLADVRSGRREYLLFDAKHLSQNPLASISIFITSRVVTVVVNGSRLVVSAILGTRRDVQVRSICR